MGGKKIINQVRRTLKRNTAKSRVLEYQDQPINGAGEESDPIVND